MGAPIKAIACIFAMEDEAEPFVTHLGLTRNNALLPTPLPCICYSGELDGAVIYVIVNGKDPQYKVDSVGTVPAALSTFAILQTLKPDLLINAGTAGGFKGQGGAVGDVYLSAAFRHHDRHIQMPVYDQYGIYQLPALDTPRLREALGLKHGIVSSGNSLAATAADLAYLQESNVSVKEMEGAAIAYVASLFKTPFFAVKAITDIVDGDRATADEFVANLSTAAQALQRTLPKVISFVVGKAASEL